MPSPSFIADEYFKERWIAKNARGLSAAYLKRIQLLDGKTMRRLALAFSTKKHRTKLALSGLDKRKRQPRTLPVVPFQPLAVIEAIINKMIANGKL